MKKSDLALLVLIVGLVGLITYFAVDSMLGKKELKPYSYDSATEIKSSLTPPSDKVFVTDAYNPTIKIKIGDQANQQPFNASSQ